MATPPPPMATPPPPIPIPIPIATPTPTTTPIPIPSPQIPTRPPQFFQNPLAPSAIKQEIPTPDTKLTLTTPAAAAAAIVAPELSATLPYTITIPSCAAWFSWDEFHDTERRILPEFFDGTRSPGAYKYYRDSIVRRFRANPSRKLTLTEARRGLVGDVGSIRRVFDFLEGWGLINYAPSAKALVKERREVEEGAERKEQSQKVCSSCKSVCVLACFTTDKTDIILCARCFVRGNYRPGVSSADFRRVDISGETKSEWTDKETLHLLEAVLQYGEDWKKVAEHVNSRSEKECVARFVRLSFGEQFLRPQKDTEDSKQYHINDQLRTEPGGKNVEETHLSKKRCLSPLADASNPIMAQVAFLSAMVGSEIAEAASQAAVAVLPEVDIASVSDINGPSDGTNARDDEEIFEEVIDEAQSELDKEQQSVEQSISDIVEVQMKEIHEKIVHFEELELQVEKERSQSKYMKDMLFADQLSILQHKA